MSDRVETFLDRMCSRIKYKTIHKELRREILTHIEEMAEEYETFGYQHGNAYSIAVSHMGNAFETGEIFNEHYRLPFDKSFGLVLWSALVTVLIYMVYPFIVKLHNFTIPAKYGSVYIVMMILLFAFGNVMYLRRGQLKASFRDAAHIFIGFLIGWIISVTALLLTSLFFRRGYYPYFSDIKIPFSYMYLPLLPKDELVFGTEYFCLWFCLMTYLIAVKSRRKIKPFTLVAGWFNIESGQPMEDENILIDGFDKFGRKTRMLALYIIGETRDKYGERTDNYNIKRYK